MFSRKNKAERTAAQAWEYLSSAVTTAGDSAREAGSHAVDVTSTTATKLAGRAAKKSSKFAAQAQETGSKLAGTAGDRVSSAKDEAWTRAALAADALAGKRPSLPWGLVIGVGLIGVALGWAAANAARATAERQAQEEELELAESAVVVTPGEGRFSPEV